MSSSSARLLALFLWFVCLVVAWCVWRIVCADFVSPFTSSPTRPAYCATDVVKRRQSKKKKHSGRMEQFCTHLMENVPITVFAGEWRKWEADAITDQGNLGISSILLHIGRHKLVQSMVQAWQKQEQGLQALVHPPHGLIATISLLTTIPSYS